LQHLGQQYSELRWIQTMPAWEIVRKSAWAPRVSRYFLARSLIHNTNSAIVSIIPIKAEDTIPLRHSVLWPDRDVSYVSLPEDTEGYHFGAFSWSHDTLVAVISLFVEPIPDIDSKPDSSDIDINTKGHESAARFRKFACHPSYQRRTFIQIIYLSLCRLILHRLCQEGIGTKLLEHVFSMAFSELGVTVVWCDARATSIGWYQRRGMTPFGGPFQKGGLEYVRMHKSACSGDM
jgi:hypothetical protein